MIVVKTPLRLSFVGGGSDLKAFYEQSDGMVISSTIDKYVFVIVKERFDEKIYINYSQRERVDSVDEIQHKLVRETMKIAGVEKGIEITTLADIPSEGSGLGSSSSITVGLLHALYTYQGTLVSAQHLAEEACEIEIDLIKKPIGKQDQYAAAFGGLNHFVFRSNDTIERFSLPMNNGLCRRFSSSTILYYTGLTRSADDILFEQQKNIRSQDKYDVMSEMVSLAEPFKKAVIEGDIITCGELLDKGWHLKKKLVSGITNFQIDEMYEKARKAGAIGGKISGAGAGGFLMLIVPRDKQNSVFEAMKGYRELPFMLEQRGSRVIFDDRGYSTK